MPVAHANIRAFNSKVGPLEIIDLVRHATASESASGRSEEATQARLLTVGRRERSHPAQSKPTCAALSWGTLSECVWALAGALGPIPRRRTHVLRPAAARLSPMPAVAQMNHLRVNPGEGQSVVSASQRPDAPTWDRPGTGLGWETPRGTATSSLESPKD